MRSLQRLAERLDIVGRVFFGFSVSLDVNSATSR